VVLAANFGYRNPRLNTALKKQIDTLPQLACQYLHEDRVLLAPNSRNASNGPSA